MEKGFFNVFNPETIAQRLGSKLPPLPSPTLKIPTSFIDYKNEKLSRKVSLRDGFGNMWLIGVTKIRRDFYFQFGWKKFIKDNTLEFGDFLIFDYDRNGAFDFKLLGINGCEKKGAGGEKKEEEINVEHQANIEPKGKNLASDNSNGSSSDDSAEDYYMAEEEEEEEEKDEDKETEKASRSKYRFNEGEEDDYEEEDEEENERAGSFEKHVSRSKARCQRDTTHKVRGRLDHFGTDIFRSGHTTQSKNPYFVEKIQVKRRDQLYVPMDVVRDYKLEIHST